MVSARALVRVAAFGVLCGAGACTQQEHGMMHAHQPKSELGAYAAFDAQGALWAVTAEGGHVLVQRSADAGASWDKPQRVNGEAEAIGTGGDSRPKIATGTGGELYVTWTKPLAKLYSGDIRFARSLDGARSFSPPITVHTDRQEITHRFDALAVNRDGRVFLAWIDKRDMVLRGKDYRGAAVYYAVSEDRGASFRGDYKVADHSCECCRIALLPRPDGSVLALWRHVFEPNVRDHALARLLPDGRVAEFRRATFDDWRIDACPHHGPSLAADGAGELHAVWFSQAPKASGVFYGRLREGGVEGQRRIGAASAEHADLAVLDRRVAIAWKEFDGQRSVLKAMLSADSGRSWSERELMATAGASEQPRVLTRGGDFYVFWHTRNEPLSVRVLR
jgi:hypothetical protein